MRNDIVISSDDEFGMIEESLKQTVESLKCLISEVIGGSESIGAASQQLSAITEEVNVKMNSINENTQQMSSGEVGS